MAQEAAATVMVMANLILIRSLYPGEDSMAQGATMMAENKMGLSLVADADKVGAAVLSERDCLRGG